MKVGIVTFWTSNDNYGQLLQCWALQEYLKSKGHSPYLINYDPNRRYFIGLKGILKKIVFKLRVFLACSRSHKTNSSRGFDLFRKEFLIISPKKYRLLKELQENPPVADVYIVGSDQVWAFLLDDSENETFFLNFGENCVRRISYAASFSMETYPKHIQERLRKNLSRFNAISVREETGVKICNNVGAEAKHVLDPTLLLDTSSYKKITSKDHETEPFVFLYYLNVSCKEDLFWEDISNYLEQKGLHCIATASSGYIPAVQFIDNVTYRTPTIPQWINYIYRAEFLVTTSFHGVVFSLIMHTRPIYIPLKGVYSRGNARAVELLTILGLESLILNDSSCLQNCFNTELDWDLIDTKISQMKASSLSFLTDNLVLK